MFVRNSCISKATGDKNLRHLYYWRLSLEIILEEVDVDRGRHEDEPQVLSVQITGFTFNGN